MNKYNPEGRMDRSRDEIQEALVNHPDNAHRREELDLLCAWRRAYERHMNEGGSAAWRAFQQKIDGEKSQSMRALTLLAERSGFENTVYHADTDNYVTLMRMLNDMPQEKRIDLHAAFMKNAANDIRLPEAGPELSPVMHSGMRELCRIYIKAGAVRFVSQDPITRLIYGEEVHVQRTAVAGGPKFH